MTPFSRFLAAARHQAVDRVPIVGSVSDFYLGPLLGVQDTDDPEAKLEMLLRGAELFPDLPLLFVITPCAALHLNMLRQVHNRDSYYERPEDWLRVGRLHSARELAQIRIPDPASCPEHLVTLQVIEWYHENVPVELADRLGYVRGLIRFENPFDRLALNMGTAWFAAMYTDPALVHAAMDVFTEASLVGARSLAQQFGPPLWVMLAEDLPSLLSPAQYQEFVAPYHRRLFEAFPNAVKFLHNDGDAAHLIEVLPECGMDIWHLGPRVPIEAAKATIGAQVALMGNVDPLRVVLQGSDELFEDECRRILRAASPGGGFVFSTGGELSPGTSPGRVLRMQQLCAGWRPELAVAS